MSLSNCSGSITFSSFSIPQPLSRGPCPVLVAVVDWRYSALFSLEVKDNLQNLYQKDPWIIRGTAILVLNHFGTKVTLVV